MIICYSVTTREETHETRVQTFLLWGRQPNETEMGTRKEAKSSASQCTNFPNHQN